MVLYTELFYAIIPACFHTFCCSVIPTSPYIYNVFCLGTEVPRHSAGCVVSEPDPSGGGGGKGLG